MRRSWTAIVGGVCLAAWSAAAAADVVTLKNGNVLRGEIVAETAAELKVMVNGGVVTLPRRTVAAIVRETPKRPKRGSYDRGKDVSEATIIAMVRAGKAREAAERLDQAAVRSTAALAKLAGLAGNVWLAVGEEAFRAKRFGEAADAYMEALSYQPAWDRELERRFYDASLAEIRTALLEQGKHAEARARVEVLRNALPDDPVAAWLDGRIAEAEGDAARARRAYHDAAGPVADETLEAARERATQAAAVGVPLGGAVDWSAALRKDPARLETPEFVIEHRNAPAAARLARALRWHLAAQSARLGRLSRRFLPSAPVTIRLHISSDGMGGKAAAWAGGHAHSRFLDGTLQTEEIDLMQDSAQLLGSALPHEVGHLMLARAIGPHRGFPYALAEGFACQFEAPWKRRWYRRLARAATSGERMTAEALLRARAYPPADRIAQFYAGSLCLVEALLDRGGMTRLVRYCERAGRDNAANALMDMYELTPEELDAIVTERLRR